MSKCKIYGHLVRTLIPTIQSFRAADMEVGVAVCKLDNRYILSNRRILSFGATYLYRCDVGETDGFIHSHIMSSMASPRDHMTAIKNNIGTLCILYRKGDEERIRCYGYDIPPKEKKQLLKEMDDIQKEAEQGQMTLYRISLDTYDKKFYLCDEEVIYE